MGYHGLPAELEVEKMLGLDGKEQIEHMVWSQLSSTVKRVSGNTKECGKNNTAGFWADMEHPNVTHHNSFIESEWWALKRNLNKGFPL